MGALSEREFFTLPELVDAFDISGISKSPSAFDMDKLNYFNAAYLRAMSPDGVRPGRQSPISARQ